jgi:DNA-directed RNA polymerase specialized sigma subunit
MLVKKVVSDEEFRLAQENKDNQHIIKYVLGKFGRRLRRDERKACGLLGLWHALEYHDDSYGRKFTTSLYKFMSWEVQKFTQERDRNTSQTVQISNKYLQREVSPTQIYAQDCIDSLKEPWQKKIIHQYFMKGMNLTEIGRENCYSKQYAQQRFASAMDELKRVCGVFTKEEQKNIFGAIMKDNVINVGSLTVDEVKKVFDTLRHLVSVGKVLAPFIPNFNPALIDMVTAFVDKVEPFAENTDALALMNFLLSLFEKKTPAEVLVGLKAFAV